MSIPNNSEKYSGRAIIEPAGVIIERKEAGLHPSTPVPAGAIICYDSALFTVGAYRKVKVTSVFAISDILSEAGWSQGYHSEEKLDGLRQIFEAALKAIGGDSRTSSIDFGLS